MQRRHFKQTVLLDQRLTERAEQLRKEAQGTTMSVCDYIHVRRAGRGVGIEPMFTNVARWFAELDRSGRNLSRLQSAAGRIAGPEYLASAPGG
jgi:hypothetical protein